MKTIYLCENSENIRNIFMTDERSYNKDFVLENAPLFKETKYIFSTWVMPSFTEDEIKSCFPNLKAVFYGAGSVQSFARPFLSCGVKVFSSWAANAVPVAEYTVAQIILANKGFFACKVDSLEAYHSSRRVFGQYTGNYDAKIGIIGAGMIGKKVISLLAPYNLEVLVTDPFLPDSVAAELNVKKVSLDTLFTECNIISNHLANNKDTVGMLNGALFEKMKPHSTFINTGRGAQVIESDLIRVLKNRPDITALLDVTYPEPPEKDSEFYTLPNCILTPHIAGSMGKEVRRMGEYMKTEYESFINNRPCKYEVTEKMLETMA